MSEKKYSAVIYTVKYEELFFLMEYVGSEHAVLPDVRGADDGEVLRRIREKTGTEAGLDIVFHHDIWYSSDGETVIFFAADASGYGEDEPEYGYPCLEWCRYNEAISLVANEEEKEMLGHAATYLMIKHFPHRKHYREVPGCESGIWYREHAVDIHSHVVMNVDDGAQSFGEGLELLRLDWEEGIRRVFATPHYGEENGYAPEKRDIDRGFRLLKQHLELGYPGMKIFLGTEWYCSDHIVERIRNGEAFPMGNSDWYMVEFLEWGSLTEPGDVMLGRLKKMKDNGIHTILAHPERYRAIQQDWDLAKQICDLGVLLQVNAYDLCLNQKDATRDLAQWMAKEELISFLGSDMHGTRIKPDGKPARRPQMKEGIRWLYDNVEYEYANEVVRLNAENMLGVDRLMGGNKLSDADRRPGGN